jgi:hypothetical protein
MAVVYIKLCPSFDSTKVRSRLSHTRSAIIFIARSSSICSHFFGKRPAIFKFSSAAASGRQVIAGRAFRTKPSTRERRRGVALDRNRSISFVEDELATADGAIRADGSRNLDAFVFRQQLLGALAQRFGARAIPPRGICRRYLAL